MKRASSETTTHKRAKFEMDNTKNRNILPKKTKVNDYSHNLLKHKSIDPKNSLVLHDYGTEFPPLPTSSDRSRQSQELYSGEHKNEVEGTIYYDIYFNEPSKFALRPCYQCVLS